MNGLIEDALDVLRQVEKALTDSGEGGAAREVREAIGYLESFEQQQNAVVSRGELLRIISDVIEIAGVVAPLVIRHLQGG